MNMESCVSGSQWAEASQTEKNGNVMSTKWKERGAFSEMKYIRVNKAGFSAELMEILYKMFSTRCH